MGTVYLLHFEKPIGEPQSEEARARYGLGPRCNDHCTCQHYVGYTSKGILARLERHRNGNGARLTLVAKERGIEFVVARTWSNVTKPFERRVKNYKKARKLCPICSGPQALGRMSGKPGGGNHDQ